MSEQRIKELEESLTEVVHACYCLRWENRKRETEAVLLKARLLLGTHPSQQARIQMTDDMDAALLDAP